MKFCYLDESGTGDQPVAVKVGVVADATRIHLTKKHWTELLADLSEIVGQELQEFHAHKFYGGSGIWKEVDGDERSRLIGTIVRWMKARKHKIVYSTIDADKFKSEGRGRQEEGGEEGRLSSSAGRGDCQAITVLVQLRVERRVVGQ